MKKENTFKQKRFLPNIILLTVRWCLRYNLSFRDLAEMMKKQSLSISHITIMRLVHQHGSKLDKRINFTLNKQITPGKSMKHISK